MNYEVHGISFFNRDDGTRAYRTLATADVRFPDFAMTVRGVRLTWSQERGYVAAAPASNHHGGVQWRYGGAFGKALASRLREMFVGIGGKLPDAPQYIPRSDISLNDTPHDLPKKERVEHALKQISDERGGVTVYTDWFEPAASTEPA